MRKYMMVLVLVLALTVQASAAFTQQGWFDCRVYREGGSPANSRCYFSPGDQSILVDNYYGQRFWLTGVRYHTTGMYMGMSDGVVYGVVPNR